MGFIFGLAIGFTFGFVVKHSIEQIVETKVGEANLNDYTAQEGVHDDTD